MRSQVVAGQWSFGLWSGAWWRSIQHDHTELDTDVIWGSIYTRTGAYPISWLGYFSADANVTKEVPHDNVSWSDFDVEYSTGFIASSFLKLEEVDHEGDVVNTVDFRNLFLTYDEEASEEMSNATAGIWAFVVNARPIFNEVKIQLQYVVTETAGELDLIDGIPIVPKSLESIILINDYPYEDQRNSLVLSVATACPEGYWDSNNNYVSGAGESRVFFHIATSALVDGEVRTVVVKDKSSEEIERTIGLSLWNQIRRKYQIGATAQVVKIQFPAGANAIVYDPTIGSGDSLYDTSSTTKILIITLSVGGVMLAIAIAIGIAFSMRRKRSYATVG